MGPPPPGRRFGRLVVRPASPLIGCWGPAFWPQPTFDSRAHRSTVSPSTEGQNFSNSNFATSKYLNVPQSARLPTIHSRIRARVTATFKRFGLLLAQSREPRPAGPGADPSTSTSSTDSATSMRRGLARLRACDTDEGRLRIAWRTVTLSFGQAMACRTEAAPSHGDETFRRPFALHTEDGLCDPRIDTSRLAGAATVEPTDRRDSVHRRSNRLPKRRRSPRSMRPCPYERDHTSRRLGASPEHVMTVEIADWRLEGRYHLQRGCRNQWWSGSSVANKRSHGHHRGIASRTARHAAPARI